jgi:DNA processing protein
MDDDTDRFALLLNALPGVGRVTAARLLERFASYEVLRKTPREQVLLRMRGTPGAERILATLFDDPVMHRRIDEAARELAALRAKRIELITLRDPDWPERLNALTRASRPSLLYAYGNRVTLRSSLVSIFARPPIEPDAFEAAQRLIRRLTEQRIVLLTGASGGFDVVVHRLAAAAPVPSMLVAHCGLAHFPAAMRPTAVSAVRGGGLLVSPFSMDHGPYDHDDRERALIQAAMAAVCIFVAPRPGTPETHAMDWAIREARPVYVLPDAGATVPEPAISLRRAGAFEEVVRSALASQEPPQGAPDGGS